MLCPESYMFSDFPMCLPISGLKVPISRSLQLCSTFSFPPDPRKLIFDPIMTIFRFNFKLFHQNFKMLITDLFRHSVTLRPILIPRLHLVVWVGLVLVPPRGRSVKLCAKICFFNLVYVTFPFEPF